MSTKTEIHDAFLCWRNFIVENTNNCEAGLIIFPELQRKFSKIILEQTIEDIFNIGVENGFPGVSIVNIIILHGGYFRLLQSGIISRGLARFVDSLYHPTFPSLEYNTLNLDINAPWITLSAQEALLDVNLNKTIVVEYGSGISTFYFVRNAKKCFSFEDNADPTGKDDWSKRMADHSIKMQTPINLIFPDQTNTQPEWVQGNLWDKDFSLLVNIDGMDRIRHFSEWGKYIYENKHYKIMILLDNSEIKEFSETFNMLSKNKCFISNHYGNVYGQLTTKQCTSFLTFHPELLVGSSPSPYMHDKKWGRLNFQF
jgi:hypothetical protein